MRTAILKSPLGLSVRGVAGTYVVLLAFNCDAVYRKGLMGFGIQRTDHENGEVIWLRGGLKFDVPNTDDGDDVSTRHFPIQKFHWGDYTTKPGRSYSYSVVAYKGKPGALQAFETLVVNVTCEKAESVGQHGHAVHFNRAAAASQAFVNRFPTLPPGEVVDPAARAWLSRGLAESMQGFIDAAQAGQGLHLFVYEFTKPELLQALQAALKRGVKLEIIYDAILTGGKGPSVDSVPLIKQFGLTGVARGRNGAGIAISHNKFMVLTDPKGAGLAVWTGSTNFTDSGIYAQTNVGHVIADPALAKRYLAWHQAIWAQPGTAVSASRKTAVLMTPVPAQVPPGATLVLSPRHSVEAVTACAAVVAKAHSLVCFTAPFAVHADLQAALVAAKGQVYGLLDKENVVGDALHKAVNVELSAAAALNDKSVLEAWQGRLLAESLHHSGVHIHSKVILVDPLSDDPIVITGSANFSNNSSVNNDENQLFIRGEKEVADVYLGEFMRMYEHYHFRDHQAQVADARKDDPKAGFLSNSDIWTDRYFSDPGRILQRQSFFG